MKTNEAAQYMHRFQHNSQIYNYGYIYKTLFTDLIYKYSYITAHFLTHLISMF